MCWGDVKLHQTAQGQDYLEFSERQTKTTTGSDYRDVRTVPPKMFAIDGNEKDPVAVYKFFSEKRPREMNYDDALFYLSVNNFKATDSAETKAWFKSSAVDVNKLNSLVKSIWLQKRELRTADYGITAAEKQWSKGSVRVMLHPHILHSFLAKRT